MTALRLILVGALVAAWTGWSLTTILRTGVAYRRGPHGRIDRRRNPVDFWGSIVALALFLMLGIGMILYGLAKAAGLFAR